VACAAPHPAPVRPGAPAQIFQPLGGWRPGAMSVGQPYTDDQMRAAIARYFPGVLQGDTGRLPIRFILRSDGRVVSTSRGPLANPVVPFGRIEYQQNVTADAGTYGPAPIRFEVTWLKPDSVSDTGPGIGFSTVAVAPRAPSDTGATPAQLVPRLLWSHPRLVDGLGARDTAYVWFVMDSADHAVRSGRANSAEAAIDAANVTPSSGFWWPAVRYAPAEVAGGTVVVALWWPR